jgi:hypothetical protein
MAALTAERNTPTMGASGFKASYPVAAATKIYKGSLVALDASGNLIPGAVATTLTSCGIALETADNSAGAAAAINCEVQEAVARFVNSNSMTKAAIGNLVYYVDDQSVTSVSTGASIAGVCVQVDSSGVWVRTGLPFPAAT